MTRDAEPRLVQSPEPLTRRNRDGVIYTRAPGVERQLIDLLRLPQQVVVAKAALVHQDDPEYVSEEALVYLIRNYLRTSDTFALNSVAERLIHRYTGMVQKYLSTLGRDAVEDGHSEITKRLFAMILDLTDNCADFLQVRFWTVLKALCIKEFQRRLKEQKRAQQAVPLDAPDRQQPESDRHPERRPIMLASEPSNSPETALVNNDLRKAALKQLDEPFRSAFVLRHYYGWPIEHADPTVRTISRHFGKTPRTIQDWLKKAERILTEWRGGGNA